MTFSTTADGVGARLNRRALFGWLAGLPTGALAAPAAGREAPPALMGSEWTIPIAVAASFKGYKPTGSVLNWVHDARRRGLISLLRSYTQQTRNRGSGEPSAAHLLAVADSLRPFESLGDGLSRWRQDKTRDLDPAHYPELRLRALSLEREQGADLRRRIASEAARRAA